MQGGFSPGCLRLVSGGELASTLGSDAISSCLLLPSPASVCREPLAYDSDELGSAVDADVVAGFFCPVDLGLWHFASKTVQVYHCRIIGGVKGAIIRIASQAVARWYSWMRPGHRGGRGGGSCPHAILLVARLGRAGEVQGHDAADCPSNPDQCFSLLRGQPTSVVAR